MVVGDRPFFQNGNIPGRHFPRPVGGAVLSLIKREKLFSIIIRTSQTKNNRLTKQYGGHSD